MRKKIDLLAPPFSGHLHPILGIAKQLQDDHDVRVISSSKAKADIVVAGLPHVILQSIDDHALLNIVNPPYVVGHNPFKLHQQFRAVLSILAKVKVELDELYEHAAADLIIADFTLPVAGLVATEKAIPWWTSLPSPCVLESSTGVPAYFGGMKEPVGHIDRFKQSIARCLIRLFKRGVFALYRKEIQGMGLKHLYRSDGSEAIYSDEKVLCLGVKPLEFDKQWPDAVEFIGPVLYTPPSEYAVSLSNMQKQPVFVDDKIHVLVTLGTHLHWYKEKLFNEVKTLAKRYPSIYFHFSFGLADGGLWDNNEDTGSENLHRYAYINYEKHLYRYAFVIHHGGAGILYHCLHHAIPSIVFPLDYDQFDHAARLEKAGVAIWLKRLSGLSEAFGHLFNDDKIHTCCQKFGSLVICKQEQRDNLHRTIGVL